MTEIICFLVLYLKIKSLYIVSVLQIVFISGKGERMTEKPFKFNNFILIIERLLDPPKKL